MHTIVQLRLSPNLDELTNSEPILRSDCSEDDEEDDEEVASYYPRKAVLHLGKKAVLLRAACRSAPSSPKRGSAQPRAVQSNEELDEWDVAPLIYCGDGDSGRVAYT